MNSHFALLLILRVGFTPRERFSVLRWSNTKERMNAAWKHQANAPAFAWRMNHQLVTVTHLWKDQQKEGFKTKTRPNFMRFPYAGKWGNRSWLLTQNFSALGPTALNCHKNHKSKTGRVFKDRPVNTIWASIAQLCCPESDHVIVTSVLWIHNKATCSGVKGAQSISHCPCALKREQMECCRLQFAIFQPDSFEEDQFKENAERWYTFSALVLNPGDNLR